VKQGPRKTAAEYSKEQRSRMAMRGRCADGCGRRARKHVRSGVVLIAKLTSRCGTCRRKRRKKTRAKRERINNT
jgi:hypothetical protein